MSAPDPELDRVAAELDREIRHAVLARSDATLAAALEGMTADVEAAAAAIEALVAVLAGPSPLVLPEAYPDAFEERTQWVHGQIEKVRTTLATEPMRVRQGNLWRDTRKAFTTLTAELGDTLSSAYADLVGSYLADDRHVFAGLPPGISGIREYEAAIDDFERRVDRPPRTVDDIRNAVTAGERLRSLREKLQADSVPERFQDQWRKLRTTGLPLAELTEEFTAWLDERGLAKSTVLSYRVS